MIFEKGELFCGPGGLAWGAQLAGEVPSGQGEAFAVRHKWANDIDRWACATFRRNICPDQPETVHNCDVKTEGFIERLPHIDALTFGFPCNDFSVVGEQRGFNGTFGPLYTYGVAVLNLHEPLWFIAENVGGLESANGGAAFAQILLDLEHAGPGYVITPHLYKFEEYGVPQTRHRIVIVGIRKDRGLKFKVPKPEFSDPSTYVTAKAALEDFPIDPAIPNQEPTRHSPRVLAMLKHIPPGGNAWHQNVPEELRLNVKGARLSQIYRRLRPDCPAYTVTGSGGGGTHIYHWAEERALTNRERARLQTFPDEYIFEGPKEQVRKQIGMAVPPKAAAIIVQAVLKTFAGINYPSIEARWTGEVKSPQGTLNLLSGNREVAATS